MTLTSNTEIRKLKPGDLYALGQILDVCDAWKKLMAIVPNESGYRLLKFKGEHLKMIEQAARQQRRNAAEIFLEEWATIGRNRPTLGILLELLAKADLFRAADYVASDILKGELPLRPKSGPAAAVNISDDSIAKLLQEHQRSDVHVIESSILVDPTVELELSPDEVPSNVNQHFHEPSISQHEKDNKKDTDNVLDIIKQEEISDLIKFSVDSVSHINLYTENAPHVRNETNRIIALKRENIVALPCVYGKQEVLTQELPAVLNKFVQPDSITDYEVRSNELPLCLNDVNVVTNTHADNDSVD